MNQLDAWINRATGGRSHRQIAVELGVGHGVLSRWVREESFPIGSLLDLCRLYNVNFLEAICVAGWATEDEVKPWAADYSVRDASDLGLVQELSRRIAIRDVEGQLHQMVREEVQAEVRGVLSTTGPIDLRHPPARERARDDERAS